jgi:hypothetical protein
MMGFFLISIASRQDLESNKPAMQWVPGALSPGVKRPWCEVDHSSLSNAEVKNGWSYNSILTTRLHCVMLC